jgi:hypothetical protein
VLRDDFSERINRVIRGFAIYIYIYIYDISRLWVKRSIWSAVKGDEGIDVGDDERIQ